MWDYELAKKIKEKMKTSKDSAINQACSCVGKVESVEPLVISAFDGEAMFDDEQLLITETFKTQIETKKNALKGKDVLITPVDGPSTIAVIDIIGG